MRYRKLDADGDYEFGTPSVQFLVDSPEAVAQAILTRLRLWEGEWFLDVTDGTPFLQDILGKFPQSRYDAAIKSRILGTTGVTEITSYQSTLDRTTRKLTVSATVNTAYGSTTINTALS